MSNSKLQSIRSKIANRPHSRSDMEHVDLLKTRKEMFVEKEIKGSDGYKMVEFEITTQEELDRLGPRELRKKLYDDAKGSWCISKPIKRCLEEPDEFGWAKNVSWHIMIGFKDEQELMKFILKYPGAKRKKFWNKWNKFFVIEIEDDNA